MTDAKLVLVEWLDSSGWNRWQSQEEAAATNLSHCVSVGFVLRDDEEMIILAHSYDPPIGNSTEWNVMGNLAIPKVAVTAVRELAR